MSEIERRRCYDRIYNLYNRIINNVGAPLEPKIEELEVRLFRTKACLEAIQKVRDSGILDVPYVGGINNETLMDRLGIVNGPSIKYLDQTLPQEIILLQIELEEYQTLLAASDKEAHVRILEQIRVAAGEKFLFYANQSSAQVE